MTDAGERYWQLWLRLEAMWEAGNGETDAAEALRDEADAPWYKMTAADREELRRRCVEYERKRLEEE